MSDLANSCEYLTIEKLCSAVSESEKAKASRHVRCKNDEKSACCYLCLFVNECETPCRFLGKTGTSPIKAEKTKTENTFINDNKIEENQMKNAQVPCCSLCNVEMSQTRTKFKIDGWEGLQSKLSDDGSGKHEEELLSVIVCLCPKCGKIDFRADEKPNKD